MVQVLPSISMQRHMLAIQKMDPPERCKEGMSKNVNDPNDLNFVDNGDYICTLEGEYYVVSKEGKWDKKEKYKC
jgi:hypothetical protein